MRAIDLKIGDFYRHRDHPEYAYAKVLEVLKPKQKENTNTYIVAKCEYMVGKNDKHGITKYFKPSDLVKLTD